MSDREHEPDTTPDSAEKQQDSVGDILRKERVTRRITIDSIAKDLKINTRYIKAIESDDYSALPPAPYVRVYLRSLAAYLMLDEEEILTKFFQGHKGSGAEFREDRSTQIQISVKKEKEKRFPWFIVIFAALALILGIYLTASQGLLTNESDGPMVPADSQDMQDQLLPDSTGIEPVPGGIQHLENSDSLQDLDSMDITIDDQESKLTPVKDSVVLSLTVTRDSVWVQIFQDGKSWRNFIRSGRTRTFRAKDSIDVHVGDNGLIHYRLNGKPLTVDGEGVIAFKTNGEDISYWTLDDWFSTFQDRI